MPIQPEGAVGVRGTVEVFPEFLEGLADLAGFSRLILIYVFDRSEGFDLTVTPFLDTTRRGVFSTRAPRRPVPIGISTVRLLEVEGNRIIVEDIDICDATPLLDIKPYVPSFDAYPGEKAGWLDNKGAMVREARADGRFCQD
jgi:tRNA-Thr(GGU) m(6)t(6)A37 methyltransferase TsaA